MLLPVWGLLCMTAIKHIEKRGAPVRNKLVLTVFLALAVAIGGCMAADANPAIINGAQEPGYPHAQSNLTETAPYAGAPALSEDLIWTANNHMPPGHFYLHLSDEQLREKGILPDLGFPVSATANYRPDGSMLVIIVEVLPNGDAVHPRTTIMIESHGFDFGYIFIDEEPTIFNVQGIPVSAGMFDSAVPTIASFYAAFEMGGISYSVNLPYYAAGDNGMSRLTEVVSAIIQNGPADFTTLPEPPTA